MEYLYFVKFFVTFNMLLFHLIITTIVANRTSIKYYSTIFDILINPYLIFIHQTMILTSDRFELLCSEIF